MTTDASDWRRLIRDVPDFPKPGIIFKDITPLLGDAGALKAVIGGLSKPWSGAGITHVVGVESRGFILAAPVALALGAGFVPVRKPGKLPTRCLREEYALEYGTDALEMHHDAMTSAATVLVLDDVLATGGTASATCRLVERAGARVIGCQFLIELGFLGGRRKLEGRPAQALISY
jgi:adenine phosphoribosyltransferase